jgi:mannose/fructose/N-acetylgalactosamine-specific phosphotransferase system component IIC
VFPVAIHWSNVIGFAMLFSALFFNEVVYLNVWYNFNLLTIFPAIAYLAVGIWLSLREGSNPQHA